MKKFKMFILLAITFFVMQDVSAEGIDKTKYSFTNVVDGKITKKIEDKSFTFELITEENYVANSCSGPEFLSCSCENNICTVDILNYGKGALNVNIWKDGSDEYINEYILVDVDIDEYLDYLIKKIPNDSYGQYDLSKYEYLTSLMPNGVSASYYSCEEKNGVETCDVDINYSYNEYINDEMKYKYETRSKKVSFHNYNEKSNSVYNISLNVGGTSNLTTYFGFVSIKDYLLISEDESIATVNSRGVITATGCGKTKIKVYDKTTLNYHIIEVEVKGNRINNIDEFLSLVNEKTIELDASNYSDIENYVNIEYQYVNENEPPIKNIHINYDKLAYDYITNLFSKKMNSDYHISYEYEKYQTCVDGVCETNLCNENTCNISFNYMDDKGENHTFNVSNFKINLTGIALSWMHFSVGNRSEINYYNFTGDSSVIDIQYDESFFEKTDDFTLTPLKIGTTTITIVATTSDNKTYTSSKRVNIYSYGLDNYYLENYIKTLNQIELPYNSEDFIDVNNLKYLESVVKTKVYNEIEIDSYSKEYLSVSVNCISYDKCAVKAYLRGENGDSLAGYTYNKHANIVYTNVDTTTISNLIKLDSEIKSIYYLSNEDVIKLEENSTSETFHENALNYVGINDVLNNTAFTTEITKTNDYNIADDIKEFTSYQIVIKQNQDIVYKRNIKVVYNYIITMSPLLDNSGESRINYLNDFVNNIITTNVTVENVKNNIYKITTSNANYNIILDQKEKIYYTSISPKHRTLEIVSNETKEIELYYYPYEGTVGEAIFSSLDESIVTVDKKGNVTGHKKGFTYVEVAYENMESRVLVAVDMTITEVLNTYLDDVPNNVIVEYASLRWSTLEQAIGNKASNALFESGHYSLNVYVTKENDKFYAQVSNYEDYSDKKEITYELKGIKTEEYVYTLNIGETKDTKLYFSEGDNYNLTFNYKNDGVAVLTHTGKLTGLKTGVTEIYVDDKYYQYYNHITVIVNPDEVYKEFKENFKDMTMHIDGVELNDYVSGYGFSNIIRNEIWNINENVHELWNSYDVDCGNINTTNKCTLHFYDSAYGNYDYEIDINIVKEGIYFEEKEAVLEIGENYPIKYHVYLDESDVTIESLESTICDIVDNNIVGISSGVCTVKYSTSNYTNYQHFVVDKEGYYELINEEINNLPNNISIKLEDKNWYNSEDYRDIVLFDTVVYEELNKFDKEYVSYYSRAYDESYEETDKNKVLVSGSPNGYFKDESLDYYYNIRAVDYSDFNRKLVKKELNITYVEFEEEIQQVIDKIQNELPKKYNMSFMQYLTFELDTRNTNEYVSLFEYSDLKKELNKICSKCTYTEEGGGGMSMPGYVEFFSSIIIRYEGMPIYIGDVSASGGFGVVLDNDFTEEEYLEVLKQEFLKAYLAAKENLRQLSNVDTYSVMPLSFRNTNTSLRKLNNDLEVTIEKSFNQKAKKPEYIFTVEDYSVAVIVDTKINGEVTYSTKLLDITPDVSNITLNIGNKKQVNIDFSPSNATNKKLAWISSDESIATVKDGLITAVKSGEVVIRVASEDGNITKEIKVTVKDNNAVIGDVTGDKKVNIMDLVTFRKYLAGKTSIPEGRLSNVDLDKDGKVNIMDLVNLRKMLAK